MPHHHHHHHLAGEKFPSPPHRSPLHQHWGTILIMKLIVNGNEKNLNVQTVRQLLIELGLGDQPVAVELNRDVVPKREHETKQLNEGDQIELVTLVGGG